MSQLATSQGSSYNDQDRLRAVAEYTVYGSLPQVEKHTNIPYGTLYDWSKTDWWETKLKELQIQNREITAAKLQNIVTDGLNAIHNRITEGDAYLKKDGEIGRKPASLRDLGTVTGISFDKPCRN